MVRICKVAKCGADKIVVETEVVDNGKVRIRLKQMLLLKLWMLLLLWQSVNTFVRLGEMGNVLTPLSDWARGKVLSPPSYWVRVAKC